MNLNDFRKTPKLVRGANKIAEMPVFQDMMRVLWAEHPMHVTVKRTVGVDEHNPAYHLGTIDGATRMMQVIQTMLMPQKDGVELKATYEPPEME